MYGFPEVLLPVHNRTREKPVSPGPNLRAPSMKAGSLFKCLVASINPELLFQLDICLDATIKCQSANFSVNNTEVPVQLTRSLNLAVMAQVMPSNMQVMSPAHVFHLEGVATPPCSFLTLNICRGYYHLHYI